MNFHIFIHRWRSFLINWMNTERIFNAKAKSCSIFDKTDWINCNLFDFLLPIYQCRIKLKPKHHIYSYIYYHSRLPVIDWCCKFAEFGCNQCSMFASISSYKADCCRQFFKSCMNRVCLYVAKKSSACSMHETVYSLYDHKRFLDIRDANSL